MNRNGIAKCVWLKMNPLKKLVILIVIAFLIIDFSFTKPKVSTCLPIL